tara:strand:- start:721 stop:1026 length:306 start_codon:yes stop_codon:yes gene_type:complete
MKKILKIFIFLNIVMTLTACNTVNKKIDSKVDQEEKMLNEWLNQSETELKIVFGVPDKIEFTDNRTRNYIYITKKYNIKCERKFEINQKNVVVGFSSKNCF